MPKIVAMGEYNPSNKEKMEKRFQEINMVEYIMYIASIEIGTIY